MAKKEARRGAFALLASALMLGFVAGCGGTPMSPSAEEPSQAADLSSAPRYVISWTMHQNLPVPEDAEMIRYAERIFNVDLDVWNLENNQYEALLDLKLAQGAIPDLFRIRQPQDLLKYRQQGVLAEIPEEMLNEYAPNLMRAIRENAPDYRDYGKIDGKYYGIPVINPTNIYRIPVVYRQDWLDKLHLRVPETLAEFEKVMYAFANEDPDGNGIKDTYGLSIEGMNVVFGAFGQIVFADQLYFGEKDGKLVIGALEPEMMEALGYLRKWYRDGVVDPEFITGENKGGYKHLSHSFINGTIGMTSMGNYYHWIQDGDYQAWGSNGEETPVEATFNAKELTAIHPQARIAFGRPFSGPEGKRGSKAYDMLMSFTAIGADAAKEPGKLETILRILDYVSANPDPDESASMEYGIEGTHWQWASSAKEDVIVLPPYDKAFSYQNTIGANLGMTVPLMPSDRREKWAATLGLDADGIYNALEVATPSLIKYGPELIKLKNKAYVSIITGDKPLEYFDEFVKEFMAAGGAQVLGEANEWHDLHAAK
ncbi:extracellular solute-binding protein [Cohnella thailandensis]|uniref:Extracellular solute-binding protein n=1 Tax=Cohnella thailandensis TaxID=557557 RepID=A0A841SW14_9BACL|nr:extracellular solute-binding protein [Cohnella thailandensis]MBB6634285.1 extracellular solute-binding protein [Cohnella thailandensis]MBP1972217.1 putative aldouronate transport system substrate-binding protein [Cohnella thailandensis]